MAWVATDIGLLPSGNFSIAQAANSDGTVIVGVADADGFGDGHAFWWTQASGMVDLGVLAGGVQSIAYGVSADGQYVVGQSDGGSAPGGSTVAVLWHVTAGGGTVTATELGYLGTGNSSAAFGISPDGTVIVGDSTATPGNPLFLPVYPFRWTSGGGMVSLGLFGSNTNGIGQAASTTGGVVVGGSNDPADVPWYWNGTLHALPFAVGQTSGAALAVSSAGTEATGFSSPALSSVPHAWIWTSGVTTLLGDPAFSDQSMGNAISADGTIIVGQAGFFPSFTLAFYWTNADGFVDLPPPDLGINPAAHGISGDGLRPVGAASVGGFQHAVYWTLAAPPVVTEVTMAELWFSNTSGFVDLTDVANRRKFISNTGGAQNLGDNGELPLSVTPPVFLTTNNLPVTFPGNNGRGGPFIVTGAALVAGASDPPGSTSSVTTGAPLPAGNGVLGDYRNGNLYAFNPATYTDNGTRRKWVRRWRGLPRGTSKAVRYSYLVVEMETGTGVPPADNPQLVLRWSDDGGHTWSAERYRPVGKLGETAQSIKFNRLGSSPRFAGSDRIFELSSTDPFKVAIIDAEVETSPPT